MKVLFMKRIVIRLGFVTIKRYKLKYVFSYNLFRGDYNAYS